MAAENRQDFDITQPAQFESLLRYVQANLGEHAANCPEDQLALKIAVCILGKGNPGEPPFGVMDDLHQLLINRIPDQDERVRRSVEFVIAYGCGWERQTQNSWSPPDWVTKKWLSALRVLERLILRYTRQAYDALRYDERGGVRGFQRKLDEHFRVEQNKLDEIVIEDAEMIALSLIRNQFDGKPKFKRFHALSAWQPQNQRETLYFFLQMAVQGSSGRTKIKMDDQTAMRITRANFFSQGMLFPMLANCADIQENINRGLLSKGEIEFKECGEIPNGAKCQRTFERDSCPKCGTPFNERHSRKITKVLLYVPNLYYMGVPRKNCMDCNPNYLPTNRKVCPINKNHRLSPRETQILIYNPNMIFDELPEELDDEHQEDENYE
jgi:hypothetical protein